MLFEERILASALKPLPPAFRAAFAASCCERMVPNYEAFTAMEGWGKPALLRSAMDDIWTTLAGFTSARLKEPVSIAELQAIMPDTEDFTSLFTPSAQNAVSAIALIIGSWATDEVEDFVTVARLSLDTVDIYVRKVDDPVLGTHPGNPAFDRWVDQHPLMQAERDKQSEDLKSLSALSILTPAFLSELRVSNETRGLQPFRRGMVLKRKN